MRFAKTVLLATTLGIAGASPSFADEILDVTKFIGDLDITNPGLEMAMPLLKFVDKDSDGFPDELKLNYQVYAQGTNTLLYQSSVKPLKLTALPTGCVVDQTEQDIQKAKVFRRDGGNRLTMIFEVQTECWNGSEYVEIPNILVYSARVDVANGAAWKYNSSGNYLLSAGGIDVSNPPDDINDHFVVHMFKDLSNGGSDSRIVSLQFSDGAVVSDIKGIKLVR